MLTTLVIIDDDDRKYSPNGHQPVLDKESSAVGPDLRPSGGCYMIEHIIAFREVPQHVSVRICHFLQSYRNQDMNELDLLGHVVLAAQQSTIRGSLFGSASICNIREHKLIPKSNTYPMTQDTLMGIGA